MSDSVIAKSYAKAIYSLGEDQNVDVTKELITLSEAINSSNALENLFFLEVFTPEERISVFTSINEKMNLSPLVFNFVNFLIAENRLNLFPVVFKNVVVLDDHKKGFLKGTIEGSEGEAPSEELNLLKSFIEKKIGKTVEVNYKKNENITAGYRVTVEDLQLDASVDNQFDILRNSIIGE